MLKYLGCRICKGEKYIYTQEDGDFIAKPCECWKEFSRKKSLEIKLIQSNFSDTDLFYDISSYEGEKSKDIVEKAKMYVEQFEERFCHNSLFFFGGMSTQKTTVAKWIGKKLLEKGLKVRYILMNELIKAYMNANFDDPSQEENLDKQLVESFSFLDLLIVDECFSKDRNTIYKSRYQVPYIDSFLRNRLETKKLATIFISNESISAIDTDVYNEYIQELIRRNCTSLEFKDKVGYTQKPEDIFK